jgi:hypothetical protein
MNGERHRLSTPKMRNDAGMFPGGVHPALAAEFAQVSQPFSSDWLGGRDLLAADQSVFRNLNNFDGP